MRAINFIWILILAVAFSICEKDNFGPQQEETNTELSGTKAIILNEGNFNFGNASLSLVDENGEVQNQVFQNANGAPLGDVLQSGVKHNDRFYFVLNNSGKVVVTDTSFQQVGEITGLQSPRYFLPVGESRAFVSDIYSDEISVIDLNQLTVISTIDVGAWVEQMTLLDGLVYAVNKDDNNLELIDPEALEVVSSIDVPAGPSDIEVDAFGTIWVMCTGGLGANEFKLYKIDPATEETEILEVSSTSGFLELNPEKDELIYASEEEVFRRPVNGSGEESVFNFDTEILVYGFEVDPATGNIWITDAADYVEQGEVFVFDEAGNEKFSVGVGYLPNGVVFW
jgi:YVTN family beta-propeller protein